MNLTRSILEWDEKYSVGVSEIDEQHKKMFAVINNLIETASGKFEKEQLTAIINSLLEYKKFHFETEEKYFKQFNFEGAEEHITEHHKFAEKLASIQEEYGNDLIMLTFELIDFIEDWLIGHLMVMDQKYIACFKKNGLK
jgi:hemerythrin